MLQNSRHNAVVVAHPDDETLWAGVLISSNKGAFDVICCTVPRRDPDRAIRFAYAVKELGGYPVLVPFVEPNPDRDIQHLDAVDLSPYDLIVTHNSKGEYGHLHHRNVHDYVRDSRARRIFTFGYGGGEHEIVNEGDDKERALRCYDHKSPADGGVPKWQALLNKYPVDLHKEFFNAIR